jgi:MFS family permease
MVPRGTKAPSGSTWNTVLRKPRVAVQHARPACDNRGPLPRPAVISLVRYAALLEPRALKLSFAASLVGRLPIGITGLAILLLVQGAMGSFAFGGAAAACYVAGLAAIAPALGRAIDRWGPRGMLLACGMVFPAALSLLALQVARGGAPWTMLLLAALAGASFPPITVSMRTYLKRALADDALLSAAYSLEAVLIELIFIAGPLLVALFVAFFSAGGAVLFAAGCGLAGTLLFLASPAMRSWQVAPRTDHGRLGPLAERGFARLIAVILLYASAFGLMEIGITAYSSELGNPALAGVLLGVMSAGSALGGLAYGSRGWHLPLALQFSRSLAVMGVGLGLLALPWSFWWFGFWSVLAGVAMAPTLIIQSMLIAKLAKPEHSTEAFTWSTSALLSGVGIGLAGGGALLERYASHAPLAAAAASALLAAALSRVALDR